ncbi:unnamed protein product [Mytilus coruscus]|uniref:DUF4371 domain-containing protein n=1 Tax=Mytilus coruscus TaxID=42192 RepID=A0A6J8AYM3_MYTCO|nr:unnamed protein product [Mytilus coruscus]
MGQGYDGCSTMTGEVSGVKTRIIQKLPNAKYFVHCRSHCLNLVVVNSCQSVAVVRNFMAILGKITWFISASSKRKNIMKSVMKDAGQIAIQFDLMYDQEECLFSQEKRLTQFLLGYLRPLSIELQSENCDLVEAHVQARSVAASFLEIRENAEEAFDGLFKRASTIANKNDITINKPRTSGRQRHRANAAAETVEQHYRINIFISLIDHIIKHLNGRFPDDIKPMLYGFYLLPRYFCNLTEDIIGSIANEYINDIPYPDDLPHEVQDGKL